MSNSVDQPSAPVSVDEALAFAVQLHRAGHLDDAEAIYDRILEVYPDQPDALNFLGILSLRHGRRDKAVELMQKAISLNPTHAGWYNNLGNVLLASERIEDAVAAYEKAVALDPGHAAAYNNLGIIYSVQQRFEDSARAYERAIELDPSNAETYGNFGNLYSAKGEIRQAILFYSKSLTLREHDPYARMSIAKAHAALGELEAAAAIYREWLEEEPDNPGVRHMLAACSGEDIPARAADAYIESTFDSFSETFDVKLATLRYRAPQLVADALSKAGATSGKSLCILDAGCGTGLCGPLLTPFAARLEGVDLSEGMLAKARTRGVYDELAKAELTQFLQSRSDVYDAVVSADTLVYFGVLDDAAIAAWRALRAGGLLIFTVEAVNEEAAPQGYRLNTHGRYSHTRSYIERILGDAGFADTTIERDVLRREMGEPVDGLVVTARKPN